MASRNCQFNDIENDLGDGSSEHQKLRGCTYCGQHHSLSLYTGVHSKKKWAAHWDSLPLPPHCGCYVTNRLKFLMLWLPAMRDGIWNCEEKYTPSPLCCFVSLFYPSTDKGLGQHCSVPMEIKAAQHSEAGVFVFISILFTITKRWNQPMSSTTNDKENVFVHTMGFYLALKNGKNQAIGWKVDRTRDYHVRKKKAELQRTDIICFSLYVELKHFLGFFDN